MKKNTASKIAVVLALTGILSYALFTISRLQTNSLEDKIYKEDYFTVNQIKYGLLSGDNWSFQVNKILEQQVDSFNFSPENKKVLEEEINSVLRRLFTEADAVLHKKQKSLRDKIRFKVLNTLVSVNDFRVDIPKFSKAIIDEIDDPKNKYKIKELLKEKVSGVLNAANQDAAGEQQQILKKYNCTSIDDFNKQIVSKTERIKQEQKKLGYLLIGMLLLVLLVWVFVVRMKTFYSVTFLFSVAISFLTLYIGISLPMIEIDARIGSLDLKLLSSHIIFKDQVIFFRTKSILDVIKILITDGKGETIFVGCLILLFSVLFPSFKLICATLYLFIKNKNNAFIKYMAFKSGKWSMADVMVVAVFMSYVGMQGILNDQLSDLNVQKETFNMLTTNKSNLQPGFIIFVCFVLFNLALAEILEHVTKEKQS